MKKNPKNVRDGLDSLEVTLLECLKEFKQCSDTALDGFNDKWLAKDVMHDLVKNSSNRIKEIEKNLEEIKKMRKELDSF